MFLRYMSLAKIVVIGLKSFGTLMPSENICALRSLLSFFVAMASGQSSSSAPFDCEYSDDVDCDISHHSGPHRGRLLEIAGCSNKRSSVRPTVVSYRLMHWAFQRLSRLKFPGREVWLD